MRTRSCMFLLLLACVTVMVAQPAKVVYLELKNVLGKELRDVPVCLNISDLHAGFTVCSAIVTDGETEIPSQLDDLDIDCVPDELAFVVDVPANGVKKIKLRLSSEKDIRQYQPRVYATMLARDTKKGKHAEISSVTVPGNVNFYNMLHGHGPMFESELVGYRIYFNSKQTVDPYGKFNKGLELEDSQFYPNDEMLAKGFGDDVLMVGNSCGVGALKGWNGEKAVHIEPVEFRTERILAKGPVRVIAEVDVKGWEYQGRSINMTNRYTLYAGHRDLIIDTYFDKSLTDEVFCTGVQNIMGGETVSYSDHKGLVGSWGRYWPVTDTVKYAKETVGIATFIPRKYVKQEVNDKDNFLYTISVPGKSSFRYYTMFTSRKETFGFSDYDSWFKYMEEWKKELEHPVEVKIIY